MSGQQQVNEAKVLRRKFGVTMAPIAAVRVYRKPMDFDHQTVKTESWILITPKNQIVRANSYDGELRKNFDPAQFTNPVPEDPKELRRKLKGYTEVQIGECPFATQA